MRKPKFDLWGGIQALQIAGRDEFYTHILTQEIGFWLQHIYTGRLVDKEEVRELIRTRGFNGSEARQLRKLAKWINDNAKRIRATRSPESKYVAFLNGWAMGSKECAPRTGRDEDKAYMEGYRAAKAALRKAAQAYAAKIGFKET